MTKIVYQVSGMTCGGCVNRVQLTLAGFADAAEVTLNPPQAVLTNPKADLSTLNQALKSIGKYELSEALNQASPAPQANKQEVSVQNWFATYKPLLLVFAYILLVCFAVEIAHDSFALHRFMPNFMAGFFLVFSFFKLLDIKGFASSYAMYDLVAQKIPVYGLIYPLIELALGTAYLLAPSSIILNWLTLIVMGISTLGVLRAVLNKQKIKCACLGAGFNLPMSTVTLIEDLLMVAMAAWMLL